MSGCGFLTASSFASSGELGVLALEPRIVSLFSSPFIIYSFVKLKLKSK
jgi:hypothetical protein